jgi:Tfp pilus assembly protein PilF
MRHLGMPSAVWADERAQSYRYLAKMDDYPERWLLKACAEAPHLREPWVDLARHYMAEGRKEEAAGMMARALSITQRLGTYISEDSAWNDAELEALVR